MVWSPRVGAGICCRAMRVIVCVKKTSTHLWALQLEHVRLALLLGDFIKGGVLGAWPQKCMECPQVGHGDMFRQITYQQLIPNLQFTYCVIRSTEVA
jgi:hypothetical protein